MSSLYQANGSMVSTPIITINCNVEVRVPRGDIKGDVANKTCPKIERVLKAL
eukprot:Pgem_evm1s11571